MKKIINKKYLIKYCKNILVNEKIKEINNEIINEFRIGKNYFYSLTDNSLQDVLKQLNNTLQNNIDINNASIAFKKELSYLHLFEPHKSNYNFIRLDIKSFFHSININDIKEVFNNYIVNEKDIKSNEKDLAYIDKNKEQTLIDAFINLVTYKIPEDSINEKFKGKRVLPMGFITSPVISNIIFRKLDIQIQKFCSERNIVYTRYADDMLFSSSKNMKYIHSDNFSNEISIIISQMNFKLNKNKTIKSKHTLSLNGYTIQYSKFIKKDFETDEEKIINEIRLSNKKLYIVKKLIYLINKKENTKIILKKLFNYKLPADIPNDKIEQYNIDQLINKLTGHRSYILSFVVFNKKYNCIQEDTIQKYIKLVDELNKIIDKYLK
jgi:hypothetical protein